METLQKIDYLELSFFFSNQKEVLINGISGIMGNKPNLIVSVENIKGLTDSGCEVTISVAEKGATGIIHKIPATELAAFLNQPMQKQQLSNAGVYLISPFARLSPEQIKDYLSNPPSGKCYFFFKELKRYKYINIIFNTIIVTDIFVTLKYYL